MLMIIHHHMLTIWKKKINIRFRSSVLNKWKLGSPEKKIRFMFTKSNNKFSLSLHYNADNSYLFVNGIEIIKFIANNKKVNFQTRFCLGNISDGFSATESREVSLNEYVYDFSVDYNSIDKSDILNIQKRLMTENNINIMFSLLLYHWVLIAL